MSTATSKVYITPEQYEEIEERSEIRHEYYRGEMFAMSGGTEAHSLITGNLIRALGNNLEDRPCKVYTNDMRVKVNATGLYTYPDVSVVCGPAIFTQSEEKTTLLNPTVVIEVLSPSTEKYDRSTKLNHYLRVDSIREIVLVAQDEIRIDRLRRPEGDEKEWLWSSMLNRDDVLTLPSIACEIPLSRIYARTDVPDVPDVPLRPAVVDND